MVFGILVVFIVSLSGSMCEHGQFAVGPLLDDIKLPIKLPERYHTGIGKCITEVATSTLVKSGFKVPSGNGSNTFLSVIEVCCKGYKKYKYDENFCIPVCNKKCNNGFCAAQNVCICYSDHTRSKNNECISTCPLGCLNGKCTWDGKCICNTGYKHEPNKKFCEPICSKDCEKNANCTAPEICTCNRGYRLNSTEQCEPICSPACGNGICVGPNDCSCYSGYIIKDKSCQANCSRGCDNGRCVATDVCACDPGYKLSTNGTKCDPVCSKDCGHGNCTAPEVCTCLPGYKVINRVCKPHCKKGCSRGECVAPDICVCKPGYTLDSQGKECKPVCESGCPHGRCISPNECRCNTGYKFIRGTCERKHQPQEIITTPPSFIDIDAPKFHPTLSVKPVYNTTIFHQNITKINATMSQQFRSTTPRIPHCNMSCLNGRCTGDNQCTCNLGYILEYGTWNRCVAFCPGGCPNGQCLSPNSCTCNYGFRKQSGLCVYQF